MATVNMIEIKPGVQVSESVIKGAAAGSLADQIGLGKYNIAVRRYGDTIVVESADSKKTFYQVDVKKVASDVVKDVGSGKTRVVSGPVAEQLAKEGYIDKESSKGYVELSQQKIEEMKSQDVKVGKLTASAPSKVQSSMMPSITSVDSEKSGLGYESDKTAFSSGAILQDKKIEYAREIFGKNLTPKEQFEKYVKTFGVPAKGYAVSSSFKSSEFTPFSDSLKRTQPNIQESKTEKIQAGEKSKSGFPYGTLTSVPPEIDKERILGPSEFESKVKFSKVSSYSVKPETVTFSPDKVNVQGKEYIAFDSGKYNSADLTWYAKKAGYEGKIYSFEGKYLFDVSGFKDSTPPVLTTERVVVQEPLLQVVKGVPVKSEEGFYVYDVDLDKEPFARYGHVFSVPKENYDALVNALMESGKVKAKYSGTYGNKIIDKIKESGEAVVRFIAKQPTGYETSKDFKVVDAGDRLLVFTSDLSFKQYLDLAEQNKLQEEILTKRAEKLYMSESGFDRTARSWIKTIPPVQEIKANVVSLEQGISLSEALSKVKKEEALKGYKDYLEFATKKQDFPSIYSYLSKQGSIRTLGYAGAAWAVGSFAGLLPLSSAALSSSGRVFSTVAGVSLGLSWTPSVVQSIKGEKPWSETSQVISESVFDLESARLGFYLGYGQTKDVGARLRQVIDERKAKTISDITSKGIVKTEIPVSYKSIGPDVLGRAREGTVQISYRVTPSGNVVLDYPQKEMLMAPLTRYSIKTYPFSYKDFPLERLKSDIRYIFKGPENLWKVAYVSGVDLALMRSGKVPAGEVYFRKSEMSNIRQVFKEDISFRKFLEGWTSVGKTEIGYKYTNLPEYSKDLEKIYFVSGVGVKQYPYGKVAVVDKPFESSLTRRMLENIGHSKSNLVFRSGEWGLKDNLFSKLYKRYPKYFFRETQDTKFLTEAKSFIMGEGGKPIAESYLISQRFVEKELSPFTVINPKERSFKSFSQLVNEIYGKGSVKAKPVVAKSGKTDSAVSLESAVSSESVKPFVTSTPEGVVSGEAKSFYIPVVSSPEKTLAEIEPASEKPVVMEPSINLNLKPDYSLKEEPAMKPDASLKPALALESSLSLEPAFDLRPDYSLKQEPSLMPESLPALEPGLDLSLKPAVEMKLEPVLSLQPESEIKKAVPSLSVIVPSSSLSRSQPKEKKKKEKQKEEYDSEYIKSPTTYLFPDLYSAMVSQAAFGKATIPEFTPEEKLKLYEKGLIRVPTKEYKGVGSSKEMWKKILG